MAGNSLAIATMTVRFSFRYDQATSRNAPVHAYALRADVHLSAMIGTAPFRTRICRGGKYSSRQTRRDGYQKYSYHLLCPSAESLAQGA
jgi:hypothetical protein